MRVTTAAYVGSKTQKLAKNVKKGVTGLKALKSVVNKVNAK
jgi:hypothetical protein